MQTSDYTNANRRAWDQTAPIHAESQLAALLEAFSQPGYSCLDATVTGLLYKLDVSGKRVAQLCCNNGRELISIVNLGAATGTGFDISTVFIDQARQIAARAHSPCAFEATDVYAIAPDHAGHYDLVYISVGALGWLPDLPAFLKVVTTLLLPGGALLIYEMHPLLDMFDGEDTTDPPPLRHSYFRTEPYVEDDGLDYYTNQVYDATPTYWFHHTLGDLLQGCIDQGLQIEHFAEYGHDVSSVFAHFAALRIKPPLCYTLVARQPG